MIVSELIYAKIVKIDGSEKIPVWRQYSFAKSQEESLYYEFYNKKIIFSKNDTSKCEKGCYLLMSNQLSVKGQFEDLEITNFQLLLMQIKNMI